MTETGDTTQPEELELLAEETSATAQTGPTPTMMYGGLPTPFYNPTASKEYYRFLFGGVLIVVGCMMPFGPEWQMAGYKTLSGGAFLVIGLGLIWSMWGAINIGRMPSMKWIGLAMLPFLWGIFKVVGAWSEPAVQEFAASGGKMVGSWGELFSTMVDRGDPERGIKIGNFFRHFGPGKFFVFFGALLVELHFILGIVGGAKHNKQAKAAGGGRRRR